jgi:HPt (histidine-containing phosphotransfer) domain-containing protein
MPLDESPLDLEILDENAEIGMEGLRELIDMYLTQADETLADLQVAIRTGAAGDVNHLAHKLAGSSVVCGVNIMVPPLRAMEQRGRECRLSDADPLLVQLTERLELSRRLLAEYLAEKERWEPLGQVPVFERFAKVQHPRLPRQQRQVMRRIVVDVFLVPISKMLGNNLGSANKYVGDCPDFRPTKMGLSPSEVRQLLIRRSLGEPPHQVHVSQESFLFQ